MQTPLQVHPPRIEFLKLNLVMQLNHNTTSLVKLIPTMFIGLFRIYYPVIISSRGRMDIFDIFLPNIWMDFYFRIGLTFQKR